MQHAVLFPLLERVCRPFQVAGTGYLRGLEGSALFVANHASHLDTLVLLRALPARVRGRVAVAAAADYWYSRRLPGAWVSLLLGAFPLVRRGWARASLGYCGELVADGWSVVIYPEGTRSADGHVHRFKPGIGQLAAELSVPVVPVGLVGVPPCLLRGAQ